MTKWAVGLTTVPKRLGDLLPRTLGSLLRGGFPQPRLFVDDCEFPSAYASLGLPVTTRWPKVRTYGNWALGMHELYYRDPHADYYVMFQDDIIVSTNLREYLEQSKMPSDGYLNLYTVPENQSRVPSKDYIGWYPSNQFGKGALALVFPRMIMMALLTDRMWFERPLSERGYRSIDGGICHSLCTRHYGKYQEYCHNPSLVQHIGRESTMDNGFKAVATSFMGEEFDLLSLFSTEKKSEIPKATPSTIIDNRELMSRWALGDEVAQALEILEIPQDRIKAWLGRPCGSCSEKQRRLNQLGWLSKKALTGATDEVKARFEEILDS